MTPTRVRVLLVATWVLVLALLADLSDATLRTGVALGLVMFLPAWLTADEVVRRR